MDQIYLFLIRNDVWLYIVSGLGLVWYLSEFWRSRQLLRGAMFGLERERGVRARNRALSFVAMFTAIILIVTYVNIQVAPTLPAELLKPPTPTPNIFATPLSSPTPEGGVSPSPTFAIAPTATLPGEDGQLLPDENPGEEPTEELLPTATNTVAVIVGDCPNNAIISSPPSGTLVGGLVTFFGTAAGDEFESYKLEALGPQTGTRWLSLLTEEARTPVVDGILASVDIGNWLPGSYFIRLTVVGSASGDSTQCAIELVLE